MEFNQLDIKSNGKIFSSQLVNAIVCSNINRAALVYLLNKLPKKELQAEKLAEKLGLSHRTVLYHLNVLEGFGMVEVRKHRKFGNKLVRSVWGLSSENQSHGVLKRIEDEFGITELEKLTSINSSGRKTKAIAS